jgi:hypothetical protein
MITNRDKKIVARAEDFPYMSRYAIQRWLFANYTSERIACIKCNFRLKKIVKEGELNRVRWPERNNSYVYFTGPKSTLWKQFAWVNELASLLRDSITNYTHEYVCGNVRSDGFFLLKNGVKYFVEIDSSNNPFDKPEKYSKLFLSDTWERLWPSFPRILVVTYRPAKVKKLIQQHSHKNLKWTVLTFDNVERIREVTV